MCERLLDLIDKNQAKIPVGQALKGRIDGQELSANLLYIRAEGSVDEPLAQKRNDFPIGTSTLAHVLIQDYVVERIAQNLGLATDVDVPPVAGSADDHRAPFGRHGVDGLHQGLDGIRVVAVVRDDRGAAIRKQVEATGCRVGVADERRESALHAIPVQSQCPGGAQGRHYVFHLKAQCASVSEWNIGQREARLYLAFCGDQIVPVAIDHALPTRTVRG